MAIALKLVLLYLLVDVSAFAQEVGSGQTEPSKCPSEVKYDRFKDETTEFCGNLVLENERKGLSAEIFGINGVAIYSGTVRRRPVSIELNVINFQIQSGFAKPRFSNEKELFLLTDSQRMVLPLQRPALPSVDVGTTGETFQITLSRPFVEALIAANQ